MQRGRLLTPAPGRGGGPAGTGQGACSPGHASGRGAQLSPPLPFPSAQSPVSRPPRSTLKTKRDFFFSFSLTGPLKVYRSLPAVGAAGLCSSPIRAAPPTPPARQQPLNYNPQNAQRASRLPSSQPRLWSPARRPEKRTPSNPPTPTAPPLLGRLRHREAGRGCPLGHPTRCSPAGAPVLRARLTSVRQVGGPLMLRSGGVGWGAGRRRTVR